MYFDLVEVYILLFVIVFTNGSNREFEQINQNNVKSYPRHHNEILQLTNRQRRQTVIRNGSPGQQAQVTGFELFPSQFSLIQNDKDLETILGYNNVKAILKATEGVTQSGIYKLYEQTPINTQKPLKQYSYQRNDNVQFSQNNKNLLDRYQFDGDSTNYNNRNFNRRPEDYNRRTSHDQWDEDYGRPYNQGSYSSSWRPPPPPPPDDRYPPPPYERDSYYDRGGPSRYSRGGPPPDGPPPGRPPPDGRGGPPPDGPPPGRPPPDGRGGPPPDGRGGPPPDRGGPPPDGRGRPPPYDRGGPPPDGRGGPPPDGRGGPPPYDRGGPPPYDRGGPPPYDRGGPPPDGRGGPPPDGRGGPPPDGRGGPPPYDRREPPAYNRQSSYENDSPKHTTQPPYIINLHIDNTSPLPNSMPQSEKLAVKENYSPDIDETIKSIFSQKAGIPLSNDDSNDHQHKITTDRPTINGFFQVTPVTPEE